MANQEPLPSKKGLREAQELFKKLRKKDPSPELIKIIKEITENPQPANDADEDSDGIAAKGPKPREKDHEV